MGVNGPQPTQKSGGSPPSTYHVGSREQLSLPGFAFTHQATALVKRVNHLVTFHNSQALKLLKTVRIPSIHYNNPI